MYVINFSALKSKLTRILMNMDLVPLYVVEGGRCQYSEEVPFIKLVNRRLVHNIVLKPCLLISCCRSCLLVTLSLSICDPLLSRKAQLN
jgi:hypothetical protein